MKLADMQIKQFVDVLASDAPAPGGGSAAALEGALGASLTTMVASLTVGKKKYAEYEELMNSVIKQGNELKNDFIEVIDRDTETFNEVSAVFAMPKNTDEEKALRKQAMQKGLKNCTIPPYDMMGLALKGLELTQSIVGKSNQSAASDLGVAAASLKTAAQGAWLNVMINVSGLEDAEFAAEYRSKAQAILDKAVPMADSIFAEIAKSVI